MTFKIDNVQAELFGLSNSEIFALRHILSRIVKNPEQVVLVTGLCHYLSMETYMFIHAMGGVPIRSAVSSWVAYWALKWYSDVIVDDYIDKLGEMTPRRVEFAARLLKLLEDNNSEIAYEDKYFTPGNNNT